MDRANVVEDGEGEEGQEAHAWGKHRKAIEAIRGSSLRYAHALQALA